MVEDVFAVGVSGTREFDYTARFRVKNNSIRQDLNTPIKYRHMCSMKKMMRTASNMH